MAKTYTAVTAANATAGNAILASDHSTNFQNVNNLIVPPMCKLNYSTTQAITTGTATFVTFNTSEFDTDSMGTTGASAKITINTTGVYLVSYSVSFSGQVTATGDRYAGVLKNGTGSVNGSSSSAYGWMTNASTLANSKIPILAESFLMSLVGGTDYIQLQVAHTQGANVNIGDQTYGGQGGNYLSAVWVGRTS